MAEIKRSEPPSDRPRASAIARRAGGSCFYACFASNSPPEIRERPRAMTALSVPEMTTDEEAEVFLDQDLSDLDFTEFQPLD
mgnify:CR=1 FL=1